MPMLKTIETGHKQFNENGYFILRNFYDVSGLVEPLPNIARSTLDQVPNSIERYNYTNYKSDYRQIRLKIEELIKGPLYETYFFDRFYFTGQDLKIHVDRPACEISLTMHISSNPGVIEWPLKIEGKNGKVATIVMEPGDAVLYMGCDRPHWRKPMPSFYSKTQLLKRKIFRQEDDSWFHQIFFHYVLANGYRAHFAYDKGK